MILKPKQAIRILMDAGFTYDKGLITAACIGWAESRLRTDARNVNDDDWKSVDRGWLQINDHWHPEVSDECADDPACAAREAFRISGSGTVFSQWATFSSGAYKGPEGLAWTMMQQAYAIVVAEGLLVERKATIDSLQAVLSSTQDQLGMALEQAKTDEATIASLQGTVAGLQTEVARLNAKIEAALADLS